ncbi:hypothetical protein [Paenibacillus methanolicus]|uniref:Uncharacterized protein n=1 Tax=Paenibacillus methanolicus TaxID=582686 RepID=A0A5S5BN19_9BACL|nr:hypothetical protein [Paenibacillus methanolicus]TYP67678.1 hypothetical protein BCM02_1233 [Paenibacillus methanolicus]
MAKATKNYTSNGQPAGAVPVPFTGDGLEPFDEIPVKVQRPAQEINLMVPYTEIRGTTSIWGIALDVSKLTGKKNLLVINKHDQPVEVYIYLHPKVKDGQFSIALDKVTIAANTSKVYDATDIPKLDALAQNMQAKVFCATAPTTGNITIFLEGVEG